MTTIETTAVEVTDSPVVFLALDAPTFSTDLANALLFSSKDQARPILNAVRFKVSDGILVLESTDSYALVEVTTVANTDAGAAADGLDVLVPRADVEAVAKACKARDNKYARVTIAVTAREVRFAVGDTVIAARTLDAEFPRTKVLWTSNTTGTDVIGLGVPQLARLGKLQGESKLDTVKLTFNGSLKPVVFTMGRVKGLQMPCRIA